VSLSKQWKPKSLIWQPDGPNVRATLLESDFNALLNLASRALGTLHEVETYLAERSDVIDGDYGIPEANREMRLLLEVREALGERP
jgi:hypothetical protein